MTLQNPFFSQFINATQLVADTQDMSQSLHAMQKWQASFWQVFQPYPLAMTQFNPQGEIAKQIQGIDTWLTQQQQVRQVAYDQLSVAKDLIALLAQKVILLMFGKFNAGKSSLCNTLANCFRQHGQTVQYFYLDQSHPEHADMVVTDEPFKEGATETTSRLQGVCLGSHLVLLDTPGLHSVTTANALLTQRFLESADGVLWLSSSSSPGQVHELDSLAQELLRQKPLLPIITRSDYFEEDEVDGEICQVLCNKPPDQRQLQQQDVEQRATEKLQQMQVNPALLKSPISVSAYMTSQANFEPTALEQAGFNDLLLALSKLMQPAIAYKQRKPAEIMLHHLQEHILVPFHQDFAQRLSKLEQKIQGQIDHLEASKTHIIAEVWREVVPILPNLIDKHHPTLSHDTALLLAQINQSISRQLQSQLEQQLAEAIIDTDCLVDFEIPSTIVYQNNEKFEQGVVNEDLLYKTLCDHVTDTLQQVMDQVIKRYDLQLESVITQIHTLQSNLDDYQYQLDQIANGLRCV